MPSVFIDVDLYHLRSLVSVAKIVEMLNIEPQYTDKTSFLHLGFRPFFFAALVIVVSYVFIKATF